MARDLLFSCAHMQKLTAAILCFFVALTTTWAADSSNPQSSIRNRQSYIAIATAFQPEIAAVRRVFSEPGAVPEIKIIRGIKFEIIPFRGKKLLVFPTGMSLSNSARATQLAIDCFPIQAFLFSGIAGGINPQLHPGDVTIPANWYYHAEAAYFNQKSDGTYEIASYFKPKYPNFGMIFPDDVTVIREGMKEPMRKAAFPADAKLLRLARKAAKNMPPLMMGKRPATLKIGGSGVAGPVFMDNGKYREWVYRVWKADCLDMESTSVAQVCWINKTPCLIVRSLSDLAGGQEGKNQEEHFAEIASKNAALVLKAVIEQM